MIGDINYGGRISDIKDTYLMKALLNTFLCKEVIEMNHGYPVYKDQKPIVDYRMEEIEYFIESMPD